MLDNQIIKFGGVYYRRKNYDWHYYQVKTAYERLTLKLYVINDDEELKILDEFAESGMYDIEIDEVMQWAETNKASVIKDV